MDVRRSPASGQRSRLTGIALGATLLAAMLAGCAGSTSTGDGVASLASNGPAGASSSPGASVDPGEAMLAYAQCMRDHGVDMADPVIVDGGAGFAGTISVGDEPEHADTGAAASPGASPVASDPASSPGPVGPDPAFEAAARECGSLLQDAFQQGGDSQPMPAEEQGAWLKYAQCMRDHGVDMPDPDFSGGGVAISISGDGDANGATYTAAEEACQGLQPGRAQGGPPVAAETHQP